MYFPQHKGIIIIIIIIFISFMPGIYNYIPEMNRVSKVRNVLQLCSYLCCFVVDAVFLLFVFVVVFFVVVAAQSIW